MYEAQSRASESSARLILGLDGKRLVRSGDRPVTARPHPPEVCLPPSGRIRQNFRRALMTLLALLLVSSPAIAQTPAPGAAPEPGSPDALMLEYQQVQARLGQLQVQVIQENVELEVWRSEIDEMVTAAMREINPDTEAHIARLDVLSQEAASAQQAQDATVIQTLMTEVMSLRSELDAAQTAAVQREDVQAEIQSFEAGLMAKVSEIDPEAMDLFARLEELEGILGAGGPGGG